MQQKNISGTLCPACQNAWQRACIPLALHHAAPSPLRCPRRPAPYYGARDRQDGYIQGRWRQGPLSRTAGLKRRGGNISGTYYNAPVKRRSDFVSFQQDCLRPPQQDAHLRSACLPLSFFSASLSHEDERYLLSLWLCGVPRFSFGRPEYLIQILSFKREALYCPQWGLSLNVVSRALSPKSVYYASRIMPPFSARPDPPAWGISDQSILSSSSASRR